MALLQMSALAAQAREELRDHLGAERQAPLQLTLGWTWHKAIAEEQGVWHMWPVCSPDRISFWFGCMEKAHLEVGSRTASKTQLWAACFGPAARPSRERWRGSLSQTGCCLCTLCSYLVATSGLVSTPSCCPCLGSGLGDPQL